MFQPDLPFRLTFKTLTSMASPAVQTLAHGPFHRFHVLLSVETAVVFVKREENPVCS